MKSSSHVPRIITLSVMLYRWLLNIGPAEFRDDYTESIVQVFRQCCHAAYQQSGNRGVLALWLPMFSEAVRGMLIEQFASFVRTLRYLVTGAMFERTRPMQQTRLRSFIIIFCAFVLFGISWLFFAHMNDPLSWWNPIVQVHPELGVLLSILRIAGEWAFILLLVGGLPLLWQTLKQGIVNRERAILLRLEIIAGLFLLMTAYVLLFLFGPLQHIDRNGGILAVLSLFSLVTGTIAIVQAIARTHYSERLLHFVFLPALGVTIGMGITLIATLLMMVLFILELPAATNTVGPMWVITELMMLVAVILAIIALQRRTPMIAHV